MCRRFTQAYMWAQLVALYRLMRPALNLQRRYAVAQAMTWRSRMRVRLITVMALTGVAVGGATAHAGPMTEQQARLKAAQTVRDPVAQGPASEKSLADVLSHIRESLLVVRGNTGYCGIIREPTWILIWDDAESAAWNGGYPVMINARTGQVLDCRS